MGAAGLRSINPTDATSPKESREELADHGRYLATIGVCEACHTPPKNPRATGDPNATAWERDARTNPDWRRYLNPHAHYAGGVPFIIRLSKDRSATVYAPNITPDVQTGIGSWSEQDIKKALRTGVRPDGKVLFTFAPHTFFRNLSDRDLSALAIHLKGLPPVNHKVLPRDLPFEPQPMKPEERAAPSGRSIARAKYLMDGLVGCRECHSYKDKAGVFHSFVGGDPADAFEGVFRLGPDLPLAQNDKGFAAFPFPGYAVLYGGNLTRFGQGGDLQHIPVARIVESLRGGTSTEPDADGRPRPLAHVMMWQFYASMTDDDAYSIAEYLKTLSYRDHQLPNRLLYFGSDWESAFEQAFGEKPSANDRKTFGH